MPKAIAASESESDADVIPSKAAANAAADEDHEMADAQDEGTAEEDDEMAPEEYVVEAIEKHRWVDKELYLYVKWKGYEEEEDKTWEPEENCAGAQEVLEEYFNRIGGRPVYKSPVRSKSRRSTGTPASSRGKKTGTKLNATTPVRSKAKARQESPEEEEEEEEEPKWSPPKGSWEDEITAIDTIEKNEKGLVCYVQWNNGRKSQHDINIVYKKCPQRMLHFYEQHLVFKETSTTEDADSPAAGRRMIKKN